MQKRSSYAARTTGRLHRGLSSSDSSSSSTICSSALFDVGWAGSITICSMGVRRTQRVPHRSRPQAPFVVVVVRGVRKEHRMHRRQTVVNHQAHQTTPGCYGGFENHAWFSRRTPPVPFLSNRLFLLLFSTHLPSTPRIGTFFFW